MKRLGVLICFVAIALALPPFHYWRFSTFIFSTFDSFNRAFSESSLSTQCRDATGSDEAFEKIINEPQKYATCLKSSIKIDEILEDIVTIEMTQQLSDEFVSKTCQYAKNVFLPCYAEFHTSIKVCLPDAILNVYEPKMRASYGFLNYMCSKKAEELKHTLMQVSSNKCIMSKKVQVEEALTENLEFLKHLDTENTHVVLKFLEVFLDENCINLVNFEDYFTSLFEECDDKRSVELISGLLRALIETTSCRGMSVN